MRLFSSSGLKTMVNTLLVSMKMLWDVMILTLFFICMSALIGMQVFVGVLRNKCIQDLPNNSTVNLRNYITNSSRCLSVCLLVCLSIALFACLLACLPACLSACLPACLSVCLPVCLSVCLSACLPVFLPV